MLRWPLYPILFVIFPVLSLYAHNIAHFEIDVIFVPIFAFGAFALVVGALFFILIRNLQKSALFVTLVLTAFILYYPAYSFLEAVRIETPIVIIGPNKILYGAGTMIVMAVAFYLWRTGRAFDNSALILNVTGAMMVLTPTINIVSYKWQTEPAVHVPAPAESLLGNRHKSVDPSHLPDIHHIILDGYARSDIYKKYFAFDNADLIESLLNQGFFVAERSRSNYLQTALSFASMLNGNYLQRLLPDLDPVVMRDNRKSVANLIRDNIVFSDLRRLGYQIIIFGSGYGPTEFIHKMGAHRLSGSYSDIEGFRFLNEFQSELLNLTPLPALVKLVTGHDRLSNFAVRRSRIQFAFANIGEPWTRREANSEEFAPVFTFMHVLGPHGPHVFRESGQPFDPPEAKATGDACQAIGPEGTTREVYIERHVSYAKYLGELLKEAQARIRKEARRDTVIIVSSDHGQGSTCHWGDLLSNTHYMRERSAILMALYFPDGDYEGIPDDLTSVNVYRVIFNKYFGAEIPLLPNEIYFSPYEWPYDFMDITTRTNS